MARTKQTPRVHYPTSSDESESGSDDESLSNVKGSSELKPDASSGVEEIDLTGTDPSYDVQHETATEAETANQATQESLAENKVIDSSSPTTNVQISTGNEDNSSASIKKSKLTALCFIFILKITKI